MANPHFMQAITEFQTNPSQAAEKYKDNQAVQHFMKEFTGIMGEWKSIRHDTHLYNVTQ